MNRIIALWFVLILSAVGFSPVAGQELEHVEHRATGHHLPVLLPGADHTPGSASLEGIDVPKSREVLFADNFDTYTAFTLEFSPWTNVDVDGLPTYGLYFGDFPNEYYTGAFLIMDPEEITGNATPATMIPHSGSQFAACWNATSAPWNDDWMITPGIYFGDDNGEVSFWARSLMETYYEDFQVGISTTGTDPADFMIISAAPHVTADCQQWTQFTYSLADYINQTVHIGIRCISNNQWVFGIDDFLVTGSSEVINPWNDVTVSPLNIGAVLPPGASTTENISVTNSSPFDLGFTTSINYDIPATRSSLPWLNVDAESYFVPAGETRDISLDIGTSDHLDGESASASIELHSNGFTYESPVNVDLYVTGATGTLLPGPSPRLRNYPNPFNPTTAISFVLANTGKIELVVYNVEGRHVKTLINEIRSAGQHKVIWDGVDKTGHMASSGIYIYKLAIDGVTEAVNKCSLMK